MSRFHTKPLIKAESVAEHSYVVAWLVTLLCAGMPSRNLLLAALAHDLPEYELGDVPSPVKKGMKLGEQFKAAEANLFAMAGILNYESLITDDEHKVLKFADNLAGYLKCAYEEQLGNTLLSKVRHTYAVYLADNIHKAPQHMADTFTDLFKTVQEYCNEPQ